jgi:probable O-glycosylation ligase (exosortase A-associated)
LQLQLSKAWARQALTIVMVLCAASALGSQSRGALLAIVAMAVYFFRNSKNRLTMGLLLVVVGVLLANFMPDSWTNRMSTIETYQDDASAMGRISAWWTAWNSAFHYPFGVGFNGARPELFALYSPYQDIARAAHSIYFQVLGNHGFVGLFIFLGLFVATWRSAGWLQRQKNLVPEANWCQELGAMCQVALVGYAVGGAFLSLAYFDLPYNIMVMVVLTRVWVEKKCWLTEPIYPSSWKTIPGLAKATKPA